ncbi:MAG: asparagine synthase (glutamine-hydrolyzing) [Desulfosalsimonadaceae bacterium]
MCGIYGIISSYLDENTLHRRLVKMGGLQFHRGPDGQKEAVFTAGAPDGKGFIGMGLARLAILDLVTGMQPIQSRADGTTIVCNGQIYNYIELRPMVSDCDFVSRGDIEVALHLYRKNGIGFLDLLNGMYGGAIYDPLRKKLILFRDRFGIKPLYYAQNDEGFAFASEIKPLFAALNIKPAINRDKLHTYFTYRYVPGSRTLFEKVMRVPPGSYLVFDLAAGTHEIHRYWNYRPDESNLHMTLPDAAKRFCELISDAVKIRLRSDVELGSFISGGIDSSAVSSIAAVAEQALRLYTISFSEKKYDELPYVKHLLAAMNHRFSRSRLIHATCGRKMLYDLPEIVGAVEEPISLGTMLPTNQLCELAARDVKAVLTGEGADELFAGYRKFMIEAAAAGFTDFTSSQRKKLLREFPELRRVLDASGGQQDPGGRYIQSEALFSKEALHRMLGFSPDSPLFEEEARPLLFGNEHPVNTAIAYETRFRLPDYVVLRLDKLSMRHSLETRTPLLDYRLAEFAASLPVSMKTNLSMNREKFICSYSYLKYKILDPVSAFRRKQPFTFPMADWLSDKKDLPDFIQDIMFGNKVADQNILDPDAVAELTKSVTGEGVGPHTLVSSADRLFSVIVFTLWVEQMHKQP